LTQIISGPGQTTERAATGGDARPSVHSGRTEIGRDIPRIGRARRTMQREIGVQDVRRSRQV